MKEALKAAVTLGGGSLVAIVAGVVSTKAAATILRPDDFGLWMLLKNTLALGLIPAAAGIGVGLVQYGPRALAAGDGNRLVALCRAAAGLRLAVGGVVVIGVAVLRAPFSGALLGGADHAGSILLIDAALALSLAYDLDVSLLNARQRVRSLAVLSTANSVVSATAVVAILLLTGTRGIAPSVLASAAIGWALSRLMLSRHANRTGHDEGRVTLRELKRPAADLMRFGASYTASFMVVAGAQLIAPAIILHVLGAREVAYYQAAALVGANYLSFIVVAAAQDYYPRLSAANGEPARLVLMADEQQRLVMLMTLPVILATLAVAPYAMPLLYSRDFHPAVGVLDWLLFGDALRFSSWTLAFIILVRLGSGTYFFTELAWGSVFIGAGWPLLRVVGIPAFGIAYLLAYVVYLSVVVTLVRRDIGLRWSPQTRRLMLTSAGLLSLAAVTTAASGDPLRLVITGLCTAAASALAFRSIVAIVRGPGPPPLPAAP